MPFTPFHFGPGLFAKSLLSRSFSWVAFVSVQVVIDCETLYFMVQHEYPIHRFFHTFLGATLAGVGCGLLLIGIKRLVESRSSGFAAFFNGPLPSFRSEFSSMGLMVGAVVGGISHPFLDGIMHSDVRPLLPWSESNPLLRTVGLEALHLGCLCLGLVGLAVTLGRIYRELLAHGSLKPKRKPPRGGAA